MRGSRAIASVSVAVAALLACNALTGVGDLEAVDCVDGCDGAAPERTDLPEAEAPVDGAIVDAGGAAVDATDAGDAAKRPSFCEGITLYLPFEGSLTATSGQGPDTPPTIPFVAGKFGQGADLTLSGGVAVYYAATYLGTPTYSLAAGSVALWLKPVWQPPCTMPSIFFKPRAIRANTSPNAGPVLECDSLFGLTVKAPDGGTTGVGYPPAAVPTWKAGTWNHLVGTWSSSSPTLRFSLNGGAPLSTSAPWVPNESPVNFLRLGSEVYGPRSVYDELIVWTRVLSQSEISALAASPVSAAVACGL